MYVHNDNWIYSDYFWDDLNGNNFKAINEAIPVSEAWQNFVKVFLHVLDIR